MSFSQALGGAHLEDFAEMAGLEFLLVDGQTKLAEFKRALRLGEVYSHLARGV